MLAALTGLHGTSALRAHTRVQTTRTFASLVAARFCRTDGRIWWASAEASPVCHIDNWGIPLTGHMPLAQGLALLARLDCSSDTFFSNAFAVPLPR